MKKIAFAALLVVLGAALLAALTRLGRESRPGPVTAARAESENDASRDPGPGETPATWRDVSADSGDHRADPGEMMPARNLSIPRIPDAPSKPVDSAEQPKAPDAGGDSLVAAEAKPPKSPEPSNAIDDAPLVPPVLLRAAWVNYPKDALKRKAEAAVEVRILVGLNGDVASVEVVDPHIDPALSTAAIESARSMKFRPATRGGRPVSVWYNYRFDFNLP